MPQNVGNHVSEDLKFKKFPEENAPGPPDHRTPFTKNLNQPQQLYKTRTENKMISPKLGKP